MKITKRRLAMIVEAFLNEVDVDLMTAVPATPANTATPPPFAEGLALFIKRHGSKLNLAEVSADDINAMIRSDGRILFNGTNLIWAGTQFSANSGKGKMNSLRNNSEQNKLNMKVQDNGPTPEGMYTLSETQGPENKTLMGTIRSIGSILSTRGQSHPGNQFRSLLSDKGWGSYRALLKPEPGTEVFGRKQMYLHGGSEVGSIGCIDVLNNDAIIFSIIEEWKNINSGNIVIEVAY